MKGDNTFKKDDQWEGNRLMNIVDVWDNDLIIRIERKKKKRSYKRFGKKNKKRRIKVKSKREPS